MKRAWPTWLGPLIALVVVYGVFAALRPHAFFSTPVMLAMLRQTVVVAICALGMTLIIITGGIDLSVGSLVALVTVIIAKCLQSGVGPLPAVAIALAISTAIGALTGVLVGRLSLMPFIVTLGSMSILRGAAKGIAHEQKIDCEAHGLDRLLSGDLFTPGIWLSIALAIATAMMLKYTRFGRHVIAVGSNEAATRLVGIDPARVKILVYALAALLTGIAGVMEFSTLTIGDPTDAAGLELSVIAAVVIGGASLTGGEGSISGSLLGALLMSVIKMGGVSLDLPNWVQEIATGAIIVLAVGIDKTRRARARS